MYKVLNAPEHEGDPLGMLLLICEILGEGGSKFGLEQCGDMPEMEPDPGLSPEGASFDVTPETLDAELVGSFNGSMYLQYLMVSSSKHLVVVVLFLTPHTAQPRSPRIDAGTKFLRGSEAEVGEFPRQIPWFGCGDGCG